MNGEELYKRILRLDSLDIQKESEEYKRLTKKSLFTLDHLRDYHAYYTKVLLNAISDLTE